MTGHKIALIPGDGVGPEVTKEGVKVLETVGELKNINFDWLSCPYGAKYYLETGEVLGEDALTEIGKTEAIYFGAIGDPNIEPGILEKGLLLSLRFHFDQYVNLRPIKLLPGVQTPLRDKKPEDINFDVVRENTEDFYVGLGGRAKGRSNKVLELCRNLYSLKFDLDIETDGEEIAYQLGVLSRKGTERVIRYAFELAKNENREKITGVDKANVLTDIYKFWREIFESVAKDYPGIETEFNYVDAITMYFVQDPKRFQVVLTPNMFGDIITDLGASIQGGIGLAPSGNINPGGISMFEPVHGSAPDIAGKGIVNPTAAIWAGAMMLTEIGEKDAADMIIKAIEDVLGEGKIRTRDLGGSSTTSEMGDAIVEKLKEK